MMKARRLGFGKENDTKQGMPGKSFAGLISKLERSISLVSVRMKQVRGITNDL